MWPLCSLIIMITISTAQASSITYYITPSSGADNCHKYRLHQCFILTDLSNHLMSLPPATNLTLKFLPGEHDLTERIALTTLSAITFETEHIHKVEANARITCIYSHTITGFDFQSINSVHIKQLAFQECSNTGTNGGAITITMVMTAEITDCSFKSNRVQRGNGGALYVELISNLHIHNSSFIDNSASGSGGAVQMVNITTVVISFSIFQGNNALDKGGAINEDSDNQEMNFTSDFNVFLNNSASEEGGAIYFKGTYFYSDHSIYTGNTAQSGGAIYLLLCSIYTEANIFQSNLAMKDGGAGFIIGISWRSEGDKFDRNSCQEYGGAIHTFSTPVTLTGGLFSNNTAHKGAGMYLRWSGYSKIEINDSTFISNSHTSENTGAVHIIQGTLTFTGRVVFTKNNGTLYAANSQVCFQGDTYLFDNFSHQGGGMTCTQSILKFEAASITTVYGNRANYGGGISLNQCTVYMMGEEDIDSNWAEFSGGGIYAIQSAIELRINFAVQTVYNIVLDVANNEALEDGGGMALIASNLIITDTYTFFINNTAKMNGGGIYLEEISRIEMRKNTNFYLKLEFLNNKATTGGAIYVADDTSTKEICENATPKNAHLRKCFFQSLVIYFEELVNNNLINTWFINNTAKNRGGDIYGGLLDRCTIDPAAELLRLQPQYKDSNGLQYIQAIASFDETESKHISSDPVRICFCSAHSIHCDKQHPPIVVSKGETFTVSLVAVDQTHTPSDAIVLASLIEESGIARLKEGQQSQHVSSQCTKLIFNAYSLNDFATLELYPKGPCGNKGASSQNVNVIFLPCVPPPGFQRAQHPTDCITECDRKLLPYISNCFSTQESIEIEQNIWIEYIDTLNTSNAMGYIVQDCPFDYCAPRPVNITLSTQEGTDRQCAFNRTGKLCGKCGEGLSLILASSQCWECTNHWLLLLIPFTLAGVLLVVTVLLLHKAVDSGALHGLLFYANILAANHSTYYPSKDPTILTVFISWLNLDLGIETCFYSGMTSTAKVLLQLVFPSYIFALMGTIIVLVNLSDSQTSKISSLLSKGKPVEGLCMLILLSYSKLLRIVITSLQFQTLTYPDGSFQTAWLYDANIEYFSKDHIAQFIVSIAIIIVGAVYTGLLLFGQCLIKWISNPRYKTIINAHHRPLIEQYRYWIGILLLARIIHYLVSALTNDSTAMLSAGALTIGLICIKAFHAIKNRVRRDNGHLATYKSLPIEVLEFSFFVNLGILSLGTLYERNVGNKAQSILAHISIAIAFVTFIGIIAGSLATHIHDNTYCKYCNQKWKHFCSKLKRYFERFGQLNTQCDHECSPRYHQLHNITNSPTEEDTHCSDLEEPQSYTGPTQDDTRSLSGDHPKPGHYDPPLITLCSPTVTSTALREELLADTEEGDIQVWYHRPRAGNTCTHQEVDIRNLENVT